MRAHKHTTHTSAHPSYKQLALKRIPLDIFLEKMLKEESRVPLRHTRNPLGLRNFLIRSHSSNSRFRHRVGNPTLRLRRRGHCKKQRWRPAARGRPQEHVQGRREGGTGAWESRPRGHGRKAGPAEGPDTAALAPAV